MRWWSHKTLLRLKKVLSPSDIVHDFKWLAKDEKVEKVNKAVSLNLGVDKDDIEELLGVVPEKLTNELLVLEQEHKAEEEARERETAGDKKKRNPKKFTGKDLAEAFTDLNNSLNSLKT